MAMIQSKKQAAIKRKIFNCPSFENQALKKRSGRKRAKKRATGFFGNCANSSAFLRAR